MKAFVVRRTLWTVVAAALLLSATFFTLALTPDPNRLEAGALAGMGAAMSGEDPGEAAREAMETYDEVRDRDRPLLDRWADWMVGYATGEWGWSFTYDRPVLAVLVRAVPLTLLYVVPGAVVATATSVAVGLLGALDRGGVVDRLSRSGVYVGAAMPEFVLAVLWLRFNPEWLPETTITWSSPLWTPAVAGTLLGPALIVDLSLFAVQAWVVRSEALEIAPAEFVKTLRASGARDQTVGRHVLRNAASPLLAMFVSEVLVVLFVTVFVVEVVFGIPGLGLVGYRGFEERDFGLVMAVVILPALVCLVGTLLKDVLTVLIDPRTARN